MAQILSGAPAAEAMLAGLSVRTRALRERGVTFDHVGITGNFAIAALFLIVAFILARASFSLYARATGRLA